MQQTQTTATNLRNTQVGGIHPKVAELDFKRLKWKLAHSSEAKMSPAMCDLAEREHRRFLTLKIMHPKFSLVPSKLQDEFWHAHILDTAAYARDCETLFGYFLHHFPYFGIYGEDDKRALDDAFAETTALYESLFGENPPKFGAAKFGAANCSEEDPKCEPTACISDVQTAARCEPKDDNEDRCKNCGTDPRCHNKSAAARCSGHPCHVPTSCACRGGPSNCK